MRNKNSKSLISEIPRPANRKGLVVFFVSVFIATIFWLLHSFDQTYQSNISIPISYHNPPEGLALKKPLPDYLKVRFESTGWDVMKFKRFKRKNSVVLNLNEFVEQESVKTTSFLISHLPEQIDKIKILLVIPDELLIDFEKLKRKEVRIVQDLDVSFNNQYGLSGPIHIEPKSVVISGPESEIDKIKEVKTEFRKYEKLESKVLDKIKLLDLSSKSIRFNQDEFDLIIPVEQLSEGTLILPIKMPHGVGDTISLIPEKVTVKYQAAVSIFNSVSHFDFEPYIQIEDLNSASVDKVKVHCKVKQDFIYRVSISPEYVDYILIK